MATLSPFPIPARFAPPISHGRPLKLHRKLIATASLDKNKRTSGSWVSPDWLTSLTRTLSPRDDSGIPVANAKLDDVSDLLGGALFLPLYKWMTENGPVYRLAAGPRNFVIVSDPAVAKHVLRNYGSKYAKGLVSEVSEFLFGSGFAIAEGSLWTVYKFCFHLSYCIIYYVCPFCL
jgi:carotenoid epsilon hydroxylase